MNNEVFDIAVTYKGLLLKVEVKTALPAGPDPYEYERKKNLVTP